MSDTCVNCQREKESVEQVWMDGLPMMKLCPDCIQGIVDRKNEGREDVEGIFEDIHTR